MMVDCMNTTQLRVLINSEAISWGCTEKMFNNISKPSDFIYLDLFRQWDVRKRLFFFQIWTCSCFENVVFSLTRNRASGPLLLLQDRLTSSCTFLLQSASEIEGFNKNNRLKRVLEYLFHPRVSSSLSQKLNLITFEFWRSIKKQDGKIFSGGVKKYFKNLNVMWLIISIKRKEKIFFIRYWENFNDQSHWNLLFIKHNFLSPPLFFQFIAR